MIMIGMAAFVFCICVAVGVYFATKGGDSPAPAPDSPAPAPAATDPRATVWSSGQKLQGDPLEIGATVIPFTTSPTGYASQTTGAVYTMSMDLYIEKAAASWRCVLSHEPSTGGDWPLSANLRRPSVYISGNDANPKDTIFPAHNDTTGTNQILNSVTITYGSWFNFTFVVNNKTMTSYINGVQKNTIISPNGTSMVWSLPEQPWNWNQGAYTATGSVSGSMKVANAYFWPSALTDAQIANLKIPTSPTPGVATTSYYMPEPFTDAKDIAGY